MLERSDESWLMWTYRIQLLEGRADRFDTKLNWAVYLLLVNLIGIIVTLVQNSFGK